MATIKEYLDEKKQAQGGGLESLFKILGGAAMGFIGSGFNPLGAVAGGIGGILGTPAKDVQSAMDKFLQWKQRYQSPSQLMGNRAPNAYGGWE